MSALSNKSRNNAVGSPVTFNVILNKKAQLSLTNPRDAKAYQKLLQFDVLTCTTLSLTIIFIRLAVQLFSPEKYSRMFFWREFGQCYLRIEDNNRVGSRLVALHVTAF